MWPMLKRNHFLLLVWLCAYVFRVCAIEFNESEKKWLISEQQSLLDAETSSNGQRRAEGESERGKWALSFDKDETFESVSDIRRFYWAYGAAGGGDGGWSAFCVPCEADERFWPEKNRRRDDWNCVDWRQLRLSLSRGSRAMPLPLSSSRHVACSFSRITNHAHYSVQWHWRLQLAIYINWTVDGRQSPSRNKRNEQTKIKFNINRIDIELNVLSLMSLSLFVSFLCTKTFFPVFRLIRSADTENNPISRVAQSRYVNCSFSLSKLILFFLIHILFSFGWCAAVLC